MEPPTPWDGEPPWRGRYRLIRPGRRRSSPLALLVAAIQVTVCLVVSERPGAPPLDGLGYALLLAGPLALVWRRRHPMITLAVALVSTAGYLALDYPRGPFFIAAIIAVFGAQRGGNRAATWAITTAVYAGYVLVTLPGTTVIFGHAVQRPELGVYLAVAAWSGVALALAVAARIRGEHFAEIARTRAEAARARQEQARRQASDERLRIARELHDVLGHHLSLINVRAGVALHLLDTTPEQAREALTAIKQASAEALREVRGVLATLNPQDESAPRQPAPGLAQVDALVEEANATGLTARIERRGQVRPLPPEVERAAYRIVQEALTNVRRHAGTAATATVTLGYGRDDLTVRVDNTGTVPQPSTSDGNGIPGMRERAAALGGSLTAGPAGDGFAVEACLPLTLVHPDPVVAAEEYR